MFFKYPYTDLYNLNLDWIIKTIKEIQEIVGTLDQIVTSFNGRDGDVELTADDVNATLIDITWASDPGETIADLTQTELDAMYSAGKRILIFVNNLGVADQVYFLQWYDNHAMPQEYTPTSALAGVASFNGMTGNVTVTGDDLATSDTDNTTIAESLAEKVPETRTINNIPLSANVSIDAEDIPSQAITGATNVEMALGNINASKVPNARTVNGKSLLNDVVLNDEDIPSTVDGQTNVEEVLTYQSEEIADLTEEMQDKADVIISSASGSIATFDDGADGLPVENLVVDIEPVQTGSGDPSPDNVRPITGWTGVKVTRTGKNFLPIQTITISGSTYFIGDVNTWFAFKAGTYTASNAGTAAYMYWQKRGTTDNNIIHTGSATSGSFTLTEDCEIRFWFYSTDASVSFTNIQIELGSTATAYQPYQGETYDITLPTEAGTVYGGTLDVTTGELVVDRALINGGDRNWSKYTINNVITFALTNNYIKDAGKRDLIQCNMFKTIVSQYFNPSPDCTITNAWARGENINIRYDALSNYTETEFKQWCTENRLIIVWGITPVTYTLTPTEITTLLGVNNVWADAGDVDVTYRADTKRYISAFIKRRRVIVCGDSYLADYSFNWGYQLKNMLGLSDKDFYNAGLSGSGFLMMPNGTSGNGFLTGLQNVAGSVLHPETITDIIVCGGLNDSTYTADTFPTATFNTNVAAFIAYCKTNYPNAKIWIGYCGNAIDADNQYIGTRTIDNRLYTIKQYSEITSGIPIAINTDLWKVFTYGPDWFNATDKLHPVEDSSKAIARAIMAWITGSPFTFDRPAFQMVRNGTGSTLGYTSSVPFTAWVKNGELNLALNPWYAQNTYNCDYLGTTQTDIAPGSEIQIGSTVSGMVFNKDFETTVTICYGDLTGSQIYMPATLRFGKGTGWFLKPFTNATIPSNKNLFMFGANSIVIPAEYYV